MTHFKTSVVEVKAEDNCLAHPLIKAIAKAENDPEYVAYRKDYKIRPVVQTLLAKTGWGIPELIKYQEHFRDYNIIVYQGLAWEDIMLEGQVESPKGIILLSDDVKRHYHVIVNITGTMANKFMCKECNTSCASEATYRCDQTCSDFMARPPCAFSAVESPAPNVIDILGAKRVSRTTSSSPRIRNPFVSARDAARPVRCSREARSTNVANGIVKSVSKKRGWASVLYETSEGRFAC